MNQEQLVTFCKGIIKLKEQLICPICLDVIEETAELQCNHKLCNDCYTTQKTTKHNVCPLCKTHISRRSLVYKDEFADLLGTFVSKICTKVRQTKKLTIEEIVHSEQYVPIIRKTTKHSNTVLEDKQSLKYVNTILPKKLIYKPLVKDCSINNKSAVHNESATSHEDTFDKLIRNPQSLCFNKKGSRIKYTRKKNDKQEDKQYKILDFQNNDTKNAVIQWLNDNRNKFNRLTQTQCYIDNSEEPKDVLSINLPSVSQVNRKSIKTIDIASNATEKLKDDLKAENKGKSRARSLDLDLNNPKNVVNRLSDFGLVENYSIEESNTEDIMKKAEENVLLNIIEDEYLNKLENEMQKDIEQIESNEPAKTEMNNKENENHTTQSSASGWRRIEKMSKTLKKKGKVPKKLNITLQSSQSTHLGKVLKVNLKNDDIHDKAYKNPGLVLKSIGTVQQGIETNVSNSPDKTDLLDVGSKQAVNIEQTKDIEVESRNSSRGSDKEKKDNKNSINTTNQEQKVIILSDVSVTACVPKDDPEDPYSLPTQKLNNSDEKRDRSNSKMDTSLSSDLSDSISELPNFGEVMEHLKNNLDQCIKNADKSKNLTKGHIENIKKHLEKLNDFHIGLQLNKVTTETGIQTDDFECQKCAIRRDNKDSLKNDNQVRRGIDISTHYSLQDEESQCNITDLLVHDFSENLHAKQPRKLEDKELKMSGDIVKLTKKILNNDFAGTFTSMEDKESKKLSGDRVKSPEKTQNDFAVIFNSLNDKEFKEMANEGVKSPKKAQNDDFAAIFPTFEDRELAKISGDGVNSPKKTQNDDFSDSLDLLHLETQALEKHYQAKSLLPDKPLSNEKTSNNESPPTIIIDEGNDLEDQENDQNELIYSLKSDHLKKGQGNVSSKRALSDSDSSDIVVAKKRCSNRFIREDLSIEFDATEKPQFEKTEANAAGLSLESDEENDEEYLDSILRKYNVPVQSKRQEQVDEDCDDIVAQVKLNVENLKRKSVDDIVSSYKTASPNSKQALDDDNLFVNDHNLSKLDNDIRMHSDTCDVITETENFEPSLKKPKLRRLNNAFDKGDTGECPKMSMSEESHLLSPIKHNKGTFCPELEDSLDGVDFEHFLMEEEVKKSENMNMAAGKSNDDLFSDEDVVETTPQKEKPIVDRSPTNIAFNLSTRFPAPDKADDAFDVDFTPLAPPPGFEDDDDKTLGDITVINVEPKVDKGEATRTLTPEKQLEDTSNKMNRTALTPLNVQVKKVLHSTPLSQFSTDKSTLGLSPIVHEKSDFERACDSRNTIISKSSQDINNQRKKNSIMTSDPKQKSILNYVKTPGASSQPKQKPCIACTRLTKDQTQSISLLTNKKLATYSAKFNDAVTHMVVSVDESRRIKDYTMKFVSAVASGIWVLGFEWVQECLKSNAIVPEEPYEALDDSGTSGPKISRLTRQENPLFKSYRFYCVRSLYSITVEEVEDVITKLGGITVRNLESLLENDAQIKLIITEGRSTQDFEVYEKWLEKYKIVTVDIEWLSRSVGRYKILSVRPYIWCSDDMLDDLGYPPFLIENTSLNSLSEQI